MVTDEFSAIELTLEQSNVEWVQKLDHEDFCNCHNAKMLLLYFTEEEAFWLPMTPESGCWIVGHAISGSCLGDNMSRMDSSNVSYFPRTAMFNWHVNTDYDPHAHVNFICPLTRHRINDNLFISNNQFTQSSLFTATAFRLCVQDPSFSTHEGNLKIVKVCKKI